jgi:hypothetical protein
MPLILPYLSSEPVSKHKAYLPINSTKEVKNVLSQSTTTAIPYRHTTSNRNQQHKGDTAMTIQTLFGQETITQPPKPIKFKVIKPVYETLTVRDEVSCYFGKDKVH